LGAEAHRRSCFTPLEAASARRVEPPQLRPGCPFTPLRATCSASAFFACASCSSSSIAHRGNQRVSMTAEFCRPQNKLHFRLQLTLVRPRAVEVIVSRHSILGGEPNLRAILSCCET